MLKLFRKFKKIKKKKEYKEPKLEKLFTITHKNNIDHMQIIKEHSIKKHFEYLDIIDEFGDFNYRHVIIKRYQDFMRGDIIKQDIFALKFDNIKYVITYSNNEIKISESKTINDEIYETTLYINKSNNDYCIGKYIHDRFKSTKFNKWYPNSLEYFNLDERVAKEITKNLINDLSNNSFILKILDLEYIKDFFKEKTNWDIFKNGKVKKKKELFF